MEIEIQNCQKCNSMQDVQYGYWKKVSTKHLTTPLSSSKTVFAYYGIPLILLRYVFIRVLPMHSMTVFKCFVLHLFRAICSYFWNLQRFICWIPVGRLLNRRVNVLCEYCIKQHAHSAILCSPCRKITTCYTGNQTVIFRCVISMLCYQLGTHSMWNDRV